MNALVPGDITFQTVTKATEGLLGRQMKALAPDLKGRSRFPASTNQEIKRGGAMLAADRIEQIIDILRHGPLCSKEIKDEVGCLSKETINRYIRDGMMAGVIEPDGVRKSPTSRAPVAHYRKAKPC